MVNRRTERIFNNSFAGISIFVGIIACIFSKYIASIFQYIIGITSLISAVGTIVVYFDRKEYLDEKNLNFVIGMIKCVVGILIIAVPEKSLILICVIWGTWSVMKAIFTMNSLIQKRLNNNRVNIEFIISIIELILGIILILELTNAIGHHIILLGLSLIAQGIKSFYRC